MNAAVGSGPVQEDCTVFDCRGDALLGIVSRPPPGLPVSPLGLVVVVGGPQYRAGSHRQFVALARHAAQAGHAVLRFDVRGMGDSGGMPRGFEACNEDIAAAIAALRRAVPQVQRVALWGLCDGASAALLYAQAQTDAALAGLVLLNPWVRSEQTQAAAQVKQYYARRLLQRGFWLRLLRGQIGPGRVAELLGSLRRMWQRGAGSAPAAAASFQQRMAQAWQQPQLPRLLVLSGRDLTAREFTEALASERHWRGALAHPALTRLDLPQADHTFSDAADSRAVEQATVRWLAALAAPARGAAAG